jgi:transcriptional regulator GlxA family with amidase domain
MSERNFARVFRSAFDVTPAKFVERARLERARALLEEESQSLEQIASDAVFGSTERMRRTFARHLKVVPDQYRRHFERAESSADAVGERGPTRRRVAARPRTGRR